LENPTNTTLPTPLTGSQCITIVEKWFGHGYSIESSLPGQVTIRYPFPVHLSQEKWRQFYEEMIKEKCKPLVRKWKGYTIILVAHEQEGKDKRRINGIAGIILALTTLFTLYLSGMYLRDSMAAYGYNGELSLIPALYVLGLLGPLLIHEAGHWSMMRKYKTPSSLPYILPAPPLQWGFLGTFGAVINMRWIPPTVDALAIIGVMGPLAGFIAAIPVTIWGLKMSLIVPASAAPGGGYIQAYPLIFLLLGEHYLPNIPQGSIVLLHPLAFAGYIVFLVTFLNLIPIAQLDGGHVIRAALGDKGHRVISNAFLVILLIFSMVESFLLLFALIAFTLHVLSRGRHPGPATPVEELGLAGQLAVIVFFILLLLTFPVPVI
jgi:Zn-dependent protease